MKKNSTPYSRREFLKRTSQATSGFVVLSAVPSFLRSGTLTGSPIVVERAFYTMGTTVSITAYGESRSQINHAITKAFQAIQRCDDLMSVYKPGSDISRLNRSGGRDTVSLDESIIDLLHHAERFHTLSSGIFDVTVEPLMHLWGFRNEKEIPLHAPSDKEIAATLDAVGFENVSFESGNRVGLLNPGTKVDLGGIAVGYSVDAAVNVLKREGIESAFINHSGDAYALGAPPEDEGWEIGIPDPSSPGTMIAGMKVRDRAVSTSGNYRNSLETGGKRIGHILDPRTGKPAGESASTTVFAHCALEADALSTALFGLPEADQQLLLDIIPETELISIGRANGKVMRRKTGDRRGLTAQ